MAATIFIKFSGFIVHSTPNSMILSAFPEKIPETGKILKNFFLSPNVGPEPTDQSRLNSIYRVLSNITSPYFCFKHISLFCAAIGAFFASS